MDEVGKNLKGSRALLYFLCSLAFSTQQAQGQVKPKDLVPKSLQESAVEATKAREQQEGQVAEKKKAAPAADEVQEGDDEKHSEEEPELNKDVVVPKKAKNASSKDATSFPKIVKAPTKSIAAYLGQTVNLKVEIAKGADADEETFYSWILSGQIVCKEQTCSIPLDGEKIKPGHKSLVVIAYNSYGSSMTHHVLSVTAGKWKPGMPFDKSLKKDVSLENVDTSVQKNYDPNRLYAESTRGNAVHSYPEHISVIAAVPRNIKWSGKLRVNNGSVLRAQEGKTEWFMLPRFQGALKEEEQNTKSLRILRGGTRLSLARKLEKGDNLAKGAKKDLLVHTPESKTSPAYGGDLFIYREPPKAKDLARRKKRGPKEEIPLDEQYKTHIVSISGNAYVDILKSTTNKNVVVPPGVELVLFENGHVGQLAKPNPKIIENLYKLTFSPWDVLQKKVDRDKAMKINLTELMNEVEERIEREDYFDVVSLLSPVEFRAKEDIRIPYYLGVASKGLYQFGQAEKYLKAAAAQDPKFVKAPWALAQMRLEEEKWDDAQNYLDEARDRMDADDKLQPEYFYYSGVASFRKSSFFSSRSYFTRSLWEQNLDNALKGSSGSFISTMSKKRPWTLVAPFGVQYDSNALSLAATDDIPDGYSEKATLRLVSGGIFNYDTAPSSDDPGTYWGGGAKLLYVKNLTASFSALDAIVTEASVSQTIKRKEKDPIKFTEALEVVFVNNKRTVDTLKLITSYKGYDAMIGYENDPINSGTESTNGIVLSQSHTRNFTLNLDTAFLAEEKYAFNKSDTAGHEFAFTVTPGYTHIFNMRSNLKGTLAMNMEMVMANTTLSTYKVIPGVSYTYFITPWLLSTSGVNYEYHMKKPDNTNISKYVLQVMLTGIF